MNSISDAFIVLDVNFQVSYINARGVQYLGLQQEEILHESFWSLCPSEKNGQLFNILLTALAGNLTVSENFFSLFHLNWHNATAFPCEGGLGVLIREIKQGSLEDQRLKEYGVNLIDVLDNIPHIVWICSPNGSVISLNRKWSQYTGLPLAGGLGYSWLDSIHPHDIERLTSKWRKSINSQTGFEHQYRIRGADGVYRWHLDRNRPVYAQNGVISYWIGTCTEIHEQKLDQDELKETNHFIQNITEASPEIICVYDFVEQRHIYINGAVYTYLGITKDEFLDMDLSKVLSIIHPEDRGIYLSLGKMFENVYDNEFKEIEYRARNQHENWIWLKTRSRVFKRDKENRVLQITSITEDITTQKEAEYQRIQNTIVQSALEKKEEFLNIASHELKAPVTSVKASVQILKRLIEKDTDKDTLRVFISKADKQIAKLTELIKHLLENAKVQSGKFHVTPSRFLIDEVISDALSHIIDKHRISIHNSAQEYVEADKRKIEQVILNFLTNALKYSPGGTEVVLTAVKDGSALKLSVSDCGIGIPKEQAAHVFERFYRVNPGSVEYSGLGLGLYICSEIIKHHNGHYGVNSVEGKGSTFWFSIPLRYEAGRR